MFEQLLDSLADHSGLLAALGMGSLIFSVAVLLAIPRIIASLPTDYFAHDKRPKRGTRFSPIVYISLRIAKNIAAVLIITLGFVLLFLPGQGLLVMLVGTLLLEYPGKYRFERKIFTHPNVAKIINAIRRKQGKEDFITQLAESEPKA